MADGVYVSRNLVYSYAMLTAIFNNSLRVGVIPMEWKLGNEIPLPKANPLCRLKKDIRPISLTPIAANVF